ncbi:MAG: aminopeptidase [Lachnospiraceae bacterium]
MGYQSYLKEYNEEVEERSELVLERIGLIPGEKTVKGCYQEYFAKAAERISNFEEIYQLVVTGEWETLSLKEYKEWNQKMYGELYPGVYEESYANPQYAVKKLGKEKGQLLCFLYTALIAQTENACAGRKMYMTYYEELFVQIYNCFETELEVEDEELHNAVYSFFYDNSELFTKFQIREKVDPQEDFITGIIETADLSDERYLYRFGKHVSENEIQMSRFLAELSESEIKAMADTYTEGFRIGFVNSGKDLSKKKTVMICYRLGFERMVVSAIKNFRKMGLEPTIMHSGVTTTSPNRQFDYDHKSDNALYYDKSYVERRLEGLHNTLESMSTLAEELAGPAIIETFGELAFDPVNKPEAIEYSEKQHQVNVYNANMTGRITNQYMKGEERSFTIISYPIPEIGEQFGEIFKETVKINTLDYKLYQSIQNKIIEVLDRAETVHITGKGKNHTDLRIAICPLNQPEKETAFENCVADVNIPVGEVFTSPVLKGTNGRLHVTQVYLNGMKFLDLDLTFTDGMITSYSCGNFETEEENHKYMHEYVLFHHDSIPMGEFAIGTNTTAYQMGRKFNIQDKLPILIAEKTGPHFAVGDTCYSHSEDQKVFNPDGKEIVAKDNEITRIRKEDETKAYFNCHTDITIPYDELDKITVCRKDGIEEDIIRDGKFVVPGTEQLNEPLNEK